jgi:hypothetical protein
MTDQTREAIEVAKNAIKWNEDLIKICSPQVPEENYSIQKSRKSISALSHLISIAERATDEERIENVMDNLAEKQLRATIKAVDKKGLMNTDWEDIDNEGGKIDFCVIAHAIVKFIEEGK